MQEEQKLLFVAWDGSRVSFQDLCGGWDGELSTETRPRGKRLRGLGLQGSGLAVGSKSTHGTEAGLSDTLKVQETILRVVHEPGKINILPQASGDSPSPPIIRKVVVWGGRHPLRGHGVGSSLSAVLLPLQGAEGASVLWWVLSYL